jgi:DNA-binding NtrC family response regulator
MAAEPAISLPQPPAPPPGFHGAVSEFKRRLIEATLHQAGGNRTRAARALGLQRTYLLRLIRELRIRIPPATVGRPGAGGFPRPKHVDTRGTPV